MPAGIACSDFCSASFASGTLVTLSVRSEVRWGSGCMGLSTSCTVAVDALTRVVAEPLANTNIGVGFRVTVNGPGRVVAGRISCSGTRGLRSRCEDFFDRGTTIVLRAIANRRVGRFDQWSSRYYCKHRRVRTCRVKVFSPTAVVAVFRRR
jgi:hypothetical protein